MVSRRCCSSPGDHAAPEDGAGGGGASVDVVRRRGRRVARSSRGRVRWSRRRSTPPTRRRLLEEQVFAPGQRRAGRHRPSRPATRGRPLSLFVQGRRCGLAPPEGPAPGLAPPVTLARPRRSTARALRSPAAANDGCPGGVAQSSSRRVHDSREQVLRLCPWWAPRRALPSRHGRHPMRARQHAAECRTPRPLRPAAVRRPVPRWPRLQGRHDALEEPLPDARRGLHRAAHAGGEGEGARVPRGRPRSTEPGRSRERVAAPSWWPSTWHLMRGAQNRPPSTKQLAAGVISGASKRRADET